MTEKFKKESFHDYYKAGYCNQHPENSAYAIFKNCKKTEIAVVETVADYDALIVDYANELAEAFNN